MKKRNISKTAAVLALAMLMSLMLPIMAFAITDFSNNLEYKSNGDVSGSVYSSVYDPTEGYKLEVWDENQNVVSVVYATYSSYSVTDNVYYYDFTGSVDSSINPIFFSWNNGEKVSDAVYRDPSSGGGTPGPWFPVLPGLPGGSDATVDGCNITSGEEVPASALTSALEDCEDGALTVTVDGDTALLPAAALKELAEENPGATVNVVTANGSFNLPVSAIDYDALAEQLDADLEDVQIQVSATTVDEETASAIDAAAEALGGTVAQDAVSFAVSAVSGDDSVAVDLGNQYVNYALPVDGEIDSSKATAVIFVDGELYFVPSTFSEEAVSILSNRGGTFTVVEMDKSFADVPAGHWAEEDIHVLANKLIVFGMTDTAFDLNRDVTRAEFASLLVRSLGLGGMEASASFSDVDATKWYAGEIGIASVTGLVYGFEDGTFRPNEVVTREQMAAMVVRAADYAGLPTVELSEAEVAAILSSFADASDVAPWAQEELALAVSAEVVFGMDKTTLNPKGNASRAQAAAMLYRYLGYVGFIN